MDTKFFRAELGIIILVTCLVSSCVVAVFTTDAETRLRSDLFANYSSEVRPSATTIIRLSFQFTSLNNLDIKEQEFAISGWWSMVWQDTRLAWTASNYNGISVFQTYQDKVWTPAIVVDNSIENLSAIDDDTIPLRVNDQGTVHWNPPGLIKTSCDMVITYFPFDEQTCEIQITSFGYTIQELNIMVYSDGVNLRYYSQDGEWDLINSWTERETFSEDGQEYARISYYFTFSRKALYYGLNMILPVVVNAVLFIFVFALPAESGEKMGFSLTSLLAFMVILTLIATDLPTTAQYTSLLELYIAIILCLGCLSVILSIMSLEIYFRPDERKIPKFIRKMTSAGMRLCCMKKSHYSKKSKSDDRPSSQSSSEASHDNRKSYRAANGDPYYRPDGRGAPIPYPRLNRVSPSDMKIGRELDSPPRRFPQDEHGAIMKPHWPRSHSELGLRPISTHATKEDKERGGEISWQTVSIVMDAVLLRLYAVFVVITTAVFMTLLVVG